MIFAKQAWFDWRKFNEEEEFCGLKDDTPDEIKKEFEKYLEDRIQANIDRGRKVAEEVGVEFTKDMENIIRAICSKYPKEYQRYFLLFRATNKEEFFRVIDFYKRRINE